MNHGLQDYTKYQFTLRELIRHGLIGSMYYFILGMLFYQNVILAIGACLALPFYVRDQRRQSSSRKQQKLKEQFREAIYALGSSLSAGRSVEQAFIQSLDDLKLLYDEDAMIVVEWSAIVHKVSTNETVESALEDFAGRTGLEDIMNFAGIFVIAKRTGGDLIHAIRSATDIINEKMDIQKEIDLLVTQKVYEQRILSYIIPGMILFFTLSSPDFLSPLYEGFSGRFIMSLALAMYLFSNQMGRRIIAIEV